MKTKRFLLGILTFFFCLTGLLWAQDKEYSIGERADSGKIGVTLYSLSDHRESNRFMRKEGERYYAVDVMILNGSREQYEYNPFQFTIVDEEENEYQQCLSSKEPKLTSGYLAPGMQVRAFVVFGLPADKKPVKLLFDPMFSDEEGVVYNLTAK